MRTKGFGLFDFSGTTNNDPLWRANINGFRLTMSIKLKLVIESPEGETRTMPVGETPTTSFYAKLINQIANGRFRTLDGPRSVAVMLYIMKLVHDPLGSLVTTMNRRAHLLRP